MLVLGAGSALALCNRAYADDYDLTFTPRVGVGMQKYKMEWASLSDKELEVDEYIPTLTVGGSVSMGRFYFDAYLQQTGTSDETTKYEIDSMHNKILGDKIEGLGSKIDITETTKADRRDYALALGYGFENGLSFSVGYKYGKTDITKYSTSVQRENGFTSSYNADYHFEAEGPFLGLGYGLNLGTGTLSLSGAVAFLDGKTNDSSNGYYDTHLKTTPSATGLSLSLAWKAPITKQFTYGISLDMYQYDFDEQNWYQSTPSKVAIMDFNPLKVTEESVGVKASLSYSF